MATTPDSVVYEVGIVKFMLRTAPAKEGENHKDLVADIFDKKRWCLNMKDQRNRLIDPGTVLWMNGTEGRMAAMEYSLKHGINLKQWTSEFQQWFEGSPHVWCKGPHFDISILESLFCQGNGGTWVPWRYSNIRDLRTLDAVCGDLEIPVLDEVPPHDSLHDCLLQVRQLTQMMKELQVRTRV
jgi:hypothetical protein